MACGAVEAKCLLLLKFQALPNSLRVLVSTMTITVHPRCETSRLLYDARDRKEGLLVRKAKPAKPASSSSRWTQKNVTHNK
jgi:hypothetical protein